MTIRPFREDEARKLLKAIYDADYELGPGREFAYEIVRRSGESERGIVAELTDDYVTLLDASTPANLHSDKILFGDIAEVTVHRS